MVDIQLFLFHVAKLVKKNYLCKGFSLNEGGFSLNVIKILNTFWF